MTNRLQKLPDPDDTSRENFWVAAELVAEGADVSTGQEAAQYGMERAIAIFMDAGASPDTAKFLAQCGALGFVAVSTIKIEQGEDNE